MIPDFVLNTGDDPAHDVWAQTHDLNLDALRCVRVRGRMRGMRGRG